jgi:Arylsulfotransferase (ASST)
VATVAALAGSHGAPIGAYRLQGAYSFVSAPSLHPPKLRADRRSDPAKLAPGYVFTANFYDLNEPPLIGQSGALILDRQLQPVWFQPVPQRIVAANLSLQRYAGRPVLAWWQGFVTSAGQTESGEDVVVDQHYRPLTRLRAGGGWVLTLHEFAISGEDAWVTVNKNVPMDLSKYGGAYNGALIDSAVQEYDLRNGRLLRSWDALRHIPLRDSYATLPTNGFPWDAYHVNSVQLLGAGRLLVSMRNTWAAYLVNVRTGRIEWTLGGRRSDFRLGPGAAFQWQHDVTLGPGSTVSMYDDHCCQITSGGKHVPASGPSRGLILRLDEQRRTAKLAAQYTRAQDFHADYMGNAQPLPNGNVFVGWGSEPYFSEYSRSGKLLFDGELPWPDLSYRATLERWVGLPLYPPAGAARRGGAATIVYASWNGATQVASWRVLAGPLAGRLSVVASGPKTGFETAIPVRRAQRYQGRTQSYKARAQSNQRFRVQALAADGRVLGTSPPFAETAR